MIVKTPAGLPYPVAILACSLFSPIPTEQSRLVAARTLAWISRASRCGSASPAARNASSQPITSTTASKLRSVSITTADTAS